MKLIYCVEDDANIRELVVYALRANGFDVRGFEDASGFYQAAFEKRPDLALLDIMLPEEDGLSILARIRSEPALCETAVIMLTAKNSEYDRVVALDGGADDYVAKPFGIMELVARVRAVLRRAVTLDEAAVMTAGPVALDVERHKVMVGGDEIALTFKEFELLQFLMRNRGIALSREKLMSNVWGTEFEGESRTVDMHIKTLRQKLGEGGAKIETVRGVGYRISD